MPEPEKKCEVCGHEYKILTPTCKNCNARLMKKRSKNRSKQTRGRDKYKRRKTECLGNKVIYGSKIQARGAARKIQEETGRMSRIYYCKICIGYHLTKFRS